MNIHPFIFLILVIPFVAAQRTVQVRIRCQRSKPSDCSSGYQFTITGKDLNTLYCLNFEDKCDLLYDSTFSLRTCNKDFKLQGCSGLCFNLIPKAQFCTQNFVCPDQIGLHKYVCSDCKSMFCQSCITKKFNEGNSQNQICAGTQCQGLGGVVNVSPCTFEVSGRSCHQCCVSSDSPLPVCTDINPMLSIADVKTWAIKQLNEPSTDNKTDTTNSTTNTTNNSKTTPNSSADSNTTTDTNTSTKKNQTFNIVVINNTNSTNKTEATVGQVYLRYILLLGSLMIFMLSVD